MIWHTETPTCKDPLRISHAILQKKKGVVLFFFGSEIMLSPVEVVTLQGINISHLGKRKIIFKMPFLGDMLVPWRVVLSHQIYDTCFLNNPRWSAGFQEISNGTRPTNGPTGPPKKNLSIYYSSINLLNRVRWVQVPFNFWWMDFFNINNIRTPTTKHTPHTLPQVLDSLPLKFRGKKGVAVGWEWWFMGRSWLRGIMTKSEWKWLKQI